MGIKGPKEGVRQQSCGPNLCHRITQESKEGLWTRRRIGPSHQTPDTSVPHFMDKPWGSGRSQCCQSVRGELGLKALPPLCPR